MPENDQRTPEQKNQFKDIYGWQREMMLAEESLRSISKSLRTQQLEGAPDWVDGNCKENSFSERRRHQLLQQLQHMPVDAHKRVHSRIREQHDQMLNSIVELQQILDEDFSAPPPAFA